MAELDRFEKSFSKGWRAAFNLALKQIASDGEISDKLMKSLAQDLRDCAGIPCWHEMSELIASSPGATLEESFAVLDYMVRDNGGHRFVAAAARVAKTMLVSQEVATTAVLPNNVIERFAIQTCRAIVEHRFFANARQYMVTEGQLPDHGAAYDWQQRLENVSRPALEKIAAQLVENPSAEGLRAPRRTVPKEPTSKLLHQGLLASNSPVAASAEQPL